MRLGYPTLRVHDLRHTAALLWLAAMRMDMYEHLIAANLWKSAERLGTTEHLRRILIPAQLMGGGVDFRHVD